MLWNIILERAPDSEFPRTLNVFPRESALVQTGDLDRRAEAAARGGASSRESLPEPKGKLGFVPMRPFSKNVFHGVPCSVERSERPEAE